MTVFSCIIIWGSFQGVYEGYCKGMIMERP